jgi:small subunit ribosomal protein S21
MADKKRFVKKKKTYGNFGLKVIVGDLPFEKAMRLFKKKVENVGLLKELRDKEFYEKPTTVRKMKRNAARKRWLKKLASQTLPAKMY